MLGGNPDGGLQMPNSMPRNLMQELERNKAAQDKFGTSNGWNQDHGLNRNFLQACSAGSRGPVCLC